MKGAVAAGPPLTAEAGARIYQRCCGNCHGSLTAATATDMAPPLALLLRDKTLTPEALRVWLANPHPPMPNLSLGRAEIDDVIAYLQTLKTR